MPAGAGPRPPAVSAALRMRLVLPLQVAAARPAAWRSGPPGTEGEAAPPLFFLASSKTSG